MNRKLTQALLGGAFVLAASTNAQAQLVVFEAGDDVTFSTLISNAIAGLTVNSLSFDLSGTSTTDGGHLVFGGLLYATSPFGGTASLVNGTSTFGFNYTSFGTGDVSLFGWDPDSQANANYGALGHELTGTVVTANTSKGLYTGTIGAMTFAGIRGYGVSLISAVPEPSAYTLLALGLAGIAVVTRRRRQDDR
ncbi:MAG TPA: PEP-CTERM sorting domain-containing protein [Burkholderiaceae bacterium]|nr:PEP-CTERM sorting domain-containing protein [Burkholderiaceae bacterium]